MFLSFGTRHPERPSTGGDRLSLYSEERRQILMELFFLVFFFVVFLLWTGHALTHGDARSTLGKTFRRLMLGLSIFFLVVTTGFELTRQWPSLTLRSPAYFLTIPHTPGP
ncbi:MAG: Hypothetical protein C75L2_00470007 [Leptospirillum sp. Group II 'C75']|nr:MAG: Hypothetical protein C75L2_00470007 [Leptospirillum sp. Group II 'C75']